MERGAWTDERLDDMVARTESQFDLLRTEMREMRAEMREMRVEMHADSTRIRRDMFHGAIALFGSQVAILAVLLAQGV